MDQTQILAGLTKIFREVFDDPDIELTMETDSGDIPDWDSLNHITIIVETERQFGIKFQTAEIEMLKNIGGFVDLISSKLAKAGR